MESEDDERLAGLTHSTFLEPPLVPSCELFESIFQAQFPVTLYRIAFRIGLPQPNPDTEIARFSLHLHYTAPFLCLVKIISHFFCQINYE